MTFLVIIYIAIIVLVAAAGWKVFEKAGRQGWEALIPIYNFYILTKIIGKPGWWTVMIFIPIVNYVFLIWAFNMVSKSFGKDEAFTAGLVILGFVFWPILGFGDARYLGPFGNPAAFEAYRNGSGFEFEKHSQLPR